MTPDDFPLLRAATRNLDHFDRAIKDIAAGLAAGTIRNAVLADARHVISGVLDRAWTKNVSEPFIYGRRYESLPDELQHLSLYTIRSVSTVNRTLAKTTFKGPAVDAMRAVVAEALPLANALEQLKTKATKGPEKRPPAPVNPNKIVRTCPCCLRSIAVTRSKMAHHGYQRPGTGYQTASCPGVRFQPLEVSPDGLAWIIDTLSNHLAATRHALDRAQAPDALARTIASQAATRQIFERARLANPAAELPPVETPADEAAATAQAKRVLRGEIRRLEQDIRNTEYHLRLLSALLTAWTPQLDVPATLARIEADLALLPRTLS